MFEATYPMLSSFDCHNSGSKASGCWVRFFRYNQLEWHFRANHPTVQQLTIKIPSTSCSRMHKTYTATSHRSSIHAQHFLQILKKWWFPKVGVAILQVIRPIWVIWVLKPMDFYDVGIPHFKKHPQKFKTWRSTHASCTKSQSDRKGEFGGKGIIFHSYEMDHSPIPDVFCTRLYGYSHDWKWKIMDHCQHWFW